MSEIDPRLSQVNIPAADDAASNAQSPDDGGLVSIARRRTLLKGLGRAAAVATATVPIRSLATGDKARMRASRDGKTVICSVSGQTSNLNSLGTSAVPDCRGNNLAFYQEKVGGKFKNWPKSGSNEPVCTVGGTSYTPDATFVQVFGGGSSNSLATLVTTYGSSAETRWVVAMLNATTCASTFPYSTSEVKNLYLAGAKTQDSARAFFQKYLEG